MIGGLTDEENSIIKIKIIENDLKKINPNEVKPYYDNTKITDIGLLMTRFPIAPKYAKMLILGQKVFTYF